MPFDEKSLVEDYIIQQLQAKSWQFMPAEELQRDSYQEPLLIPNLIRAIEKLNQGLGLGEEETNKVLNDLKLAGTGVEGAKRILNLYKLGVPVKFEKDRVVKFVQLFDFQTTANNELIVTRQVNYDSRERIRTDIMLYVNGIPLVDIECKNPASITESWHNAYVQIKDYEQIVPELYKYVQIGVAAESKARYFPIVPWQEEVMTHEWREPEMDSIDATVEMLAPATLLDILKNFLFYREEHGNAGKAVARYMQYRAANKMAARVIDNLVGPVPRTGWMGTNGPVESGVPARSGTAPYTKKKWPDVAPDIDVGPAPRAGRTKGLVWHWQGSGKTLTMIFAANKLYYHKALENPSIFFIVDRLELEDQLYKEFNALDIVATEIIDTITKLKEVLNYDDYRGKRGVFITLIHKFRPEELKEMQAKLEAVSKTKETIMNRKNIVAFIDEGHRTQYGMLAVQMKAMLKSAFFFALTGTPISKKGKDTYLEFSYPPEEPYLDRYFITDSIRDGFTVKIVYQPRLEKEVHLKKELLKGFLDVEYEELPEDIRDIVEEKVKKKLSIIKLVLEDPERIKVVAADIADHFKEHVDGKFKAMVVAASRKACKIYKEELDKHLPKEWSQVVMTAAEREEKKWAQQYVAETRAVYGRKEIKDINKEAVENFKETELPKILVVTDMLLTGFDAPILQTMYLDKPLKEHRLLQAVARTNRPFKDLKEAGLIIDYVGILKEFKRALEMYAEEDIKGALYGYDSLREEFVATINDLLQIFKEVPRDYERIMLFKAIEVITADEGREKEFVERYRHLRKLFELLGADEIKLEHFENYKWLSAVYIYYMKMAMDRPAYETQVEKYYEKTIKYIHKSTEIEKLENELPAIAFDEDYLLKLEEKVSDKKERAANILFTLNRMILVERHRNPVYESLVEKVEKLLELWKEKTKDYGEIYKRAADVIKGADILTQRQRALGFSNMEYSMLLALESRLGESDGLAAEVKNVADSLEKHMFPGWINQITVRKEVERDVRRFAVGLKNKRGLSMADMNMLHVKLMESVRNYGAS